MDMKKQQLTAQDANRSFFRLVKAFNTPEKSQTFDVRSLRPGSSDQQVADKLADYFNRISAEFDPLEPGQTLQARDRSLDPLAPHEVASRLKHFRKPKSMVTGDVFPSIVTKFSDFFAIPLTDIYNEIAQSGSWPDIWKTEYVTVIPKVSCPSDFGDLRNISCTMLVSKVMESFVLGWASQEVAVKYNQFGGIKGCSGSHMIIGVWQKIMSNLEDRRAATVLTSIDYAKAFNRLSFQHCLAAFARRGASAPVLKLLAAFLTDRRMMVRVGAAWSSQRKVTGGCPQGSILGVLLFNIVTDDLEDGSDYVKRSGRPEVGVDEEEEDSFVNARPDGPALGGMAPTSPTIAPQQMPESPFGPPGESSTEDSFHSARSNLSSELSADEVFESSPAGSPTCPLTISLSPIGRPGVMDVRLDSADVTVRRCRHVVYSDEEDITPPHEPTTTCLGAWDPRLVEVNKYVDDNLQEEAVNFENADRIEENGQIWKVKQAIPSQNVFRHVVRRAEERGMNVNTGKTGMLCISDSQNFQTRSFILDRDGNRIVSGEKLKVLGWHFSRKPTPAAHIDAMKKKFRERYWVLRHLRHNGFST